MEVVLQKMQKLGAFSFGFLFEQTLIMDMKKNKAIFRVPQTILICAFFPRIVVPTAIIVNYPIRSNYNGRAGYMHSSNGDLGFYSPPKHGAHKKLWLFLDPGSNPLPWYGLLTKKSETIKISIFAALYTK